MKKRTAFIGAILSLIPLGQPLIIKTGVILSTTSLMLSLNEKVYADNYQTYIESAYKKGNENKWYEAINYLDKAIELRPFDSYPYWGRGIAKSMVGDKNGACADWNKALSLGEEKVKELLSEADC